MSKLTAAYIAGFVDGEGYIGITKDNSRRNYRRTDFYKAVVKVANTNKEIIQWLKDSFGGTLYYRKRDNDNWKNALCWTLEGKNLIPFIDKIYPYLRVKKKQAEIVKKFRKTFKKGSYSYIKRDARNGGTFVSTTLNKDVVQHREALYKQIRELNKKGKSLHVERLNNETS